jgi:hypothetical protein
VKHAQQPVDFTACRLSWLDFLPLCWQEQSRLLGL